MVFPGISQGRYFSQLPYIIMAVDALIAGILCMLLPETNNAPTAETLESVDLEEGVAIDLQSEENEELAKGKDGAGEKLLEEKKNTAV